LSGFSARDPLAASPRIQVLSAYLKEPKSSTAMKTFDIPIIYRSPLITAIKKKRKQQDKMKKDFTPTMLDFGPLQIMLARHFGFCYGVENAIEIAFRILDENPGKRVFLLSEMIHNPHVNSDLRDRGVRFIMDTSGKQLLPWEEITSEDIVIIPAFGTTREIEARLRDIGIDTRHYNTTCPFVERVWNKAESIGEKDFTVIVHGKPGHEETRATFSHSRTHTPTIMVRDMKEARLLADFMLGRRPAREFEEVFRGQYSSGFDIEKDLLHVGVVNQTTMLAHETQAIADFFKQVMAEKYGDDNEDGLQEHFADTKDTLCYATNDNQNAIRQILNEDADLAIVVGGYNSSNTSHLVELCEEKMPTYFVSSENKLLSEQEILHWDCGLAKEIKTTGYLPVKEPIRIIITSGASCPDALVEGVIRRLLSFYGLENKIEQMIEAYDG
jgi:4-hydroxy-3-methylbut-2-enyl diphosphate reductase